MPLSCPHAHQSLGLFSSPALVAGHPGHELRAFGWMSANRPRVHLITDGSGRSGVSRTHASSEVIAAVGAPPGEIFGRLSDAAIYRAILDGDIAIFLQLVDELAASFVKHRVDCVAGDAAEGFNPTHDLCRALINSAVLMAERTTGRTIANLEFCLTEWEPDCAEPAHDSRCRHFILDDRLLHRKLAAAASYGELQAEVQDAVSRRGEEYFRVECYKHVAGRRLPRPSGKPLYELWGEQRVAQGEYSFVIRFREHVSPIAEAMLRHAETSPTATADTPRPSPRLKPVAST
jgi:hypothetical protein